MLKLTKNNDEPIGVFATYHDLYRYLTNWRKRKRLVSSPPSQQERLSSSAIEGVLNATGIDYAVPQYQSIPHYQNYVTEQGKKEGWEPSLLHASSGAGVAAKGRDKQWCLACCRAYGLIVTETDNEGGTPGRLMEDKITALPGDATHTPSPENRGGGI